jgi:putative zinc finger/helix-turn-helix YgiT family protein
MKNHVCQFLRKRATVKRPFLFTGSGLSNVYVAGIEYEECPQCGNVAGVFPAPISLLQTLTKAVVTKPSPLTGAEIRYLRKGLRKKATDFGQLVGVSSEQVSRWENDRNSPEKAADKLIRVLASKTDEELNSVINQMYGTTPRNEAYLLKFNGSWRGEVRAVSTTRPEKLF